MNRDLQKKIGRLFVAGFDGLEAGTHTRFLMEDLKIGNWIYFARNIDHYEQVAELSRKMIHDTLQFNGGFPFITIDQEGGVVSRFHGDLNTYPGAMACAAANDTEKVRRSSEITAEHLRSLGINMNLAPVADINSNPANPIVGPRSFGDDPEQVSCFVLASAEGSIRGGVVPVLKHFPGHGDCDVDSHLALPLLPHSRRLMEKRELVPFVKGIKAGLPAIMVAHMIVPAFDDSGLPASLSSRIIDTLLRKKMGFKGLVLTDCLEMKGIRNDYTTEEAVVLALRAGADLLFISHTPEEQEKGFKSIYDEVLSGRMSETRINESLTRIDACRKTCLPRMEEKIPLVSGWKGKNPDPEMEEISRKSITLLRNRLFLPAGGFPDEPESLILILQRSEQFIGENTVAGGNPLLRIKTSFPASGFRIIPAEKVEEELKNVPVRVEEYKRILVVTADAAFHPGAIDSIQKLIDTGVPVGVAVMRSPYEAGYFTGADFLILTYENTVLAADSLIGVLKGKFTPTGICPVYIPGL